MNSLKVHKRETEHSRRRLGMMGMKYSWGTVIREAGRPWETESAEAGMRQGQWGTGRDTRRSRTHRGNNRGDEAVRGPGGPNRGQGSQGC